MTKIQIRRDTSANWKTNNPVLAVGELALETDTMLMKVGDGSSTYLNLSYQNGCNECFNKDTDGNFNNYTKEGCYFISANATIQNGPTSSSGVALNGGFYLLVYNRSNLASSVADPVVLHLQLAFAQGMAWAPIQDYTQLNGQLFIRTYHSSGGNWTPWLEVTTNFILKDLLVAGDNISLDVDRTTGKVTISSTIPTNMVTTDTVQTISGLKTFTGNVTLNGQIWLGTDGNYGLTFYQSGNTSYISSALNTNNILVGTSSGNIANLDMQLGNRFQININNSNAFLATSSQITTYLPMVHYNGSAYETYLTTADNGTIANLSMPSISTFTDKTLPASGTATSATEAGYLYIDKTAAAVGEYIQVTVSDTSSNVVYSDDKYAVVANQALKLMVPIPNGCSYTVSYTATGDTNTYRFIKTTGQNT